MKKQKKRRKGKGWVRVAAYSLTALGCAFLLLVGSISVYSMVALSPEEDERLFREVGNNGGARLYYHAEGGEAVEALPDYEAVEWESERLFSGERCFYTPIEDMPKHLCDAFVAIEDHRFYRHGGVDILRTGKAALNSLFHFEARFGGSTITQQLIKNIGGEKEKTASRKIREMLRARALEGRHTKSEILEAYLNIVPMSDGCIGVGAGSLLYFNKQPKDLTLAEAASIAAVTRAPSVYAPSKNEKKHKERRDAVLLRMKECGMISEDAYKEARETPVTLSCGIRGGEGVRSWYTEKVIEDVKNDLLSEGYSEASATALLYRGGVRIYTAVDIEAQRTAEACFETGGVFDGYEGLSSAFVLLSARDGRLAALVGNCGEKTGNLLLNHAAHARYAPGSALKPVALYAPAVEDGLISEATVFDDVPSRFDGDAPWPRNSPSVYAGLMPAAEALAHSKNTVAVSLYDRLGAERIYTALTRVGVDTLVRRRSTERGVLTDLAPAPLALGELTDGVSLLTLSRAYLPLADEGRMHSVRSYLLVVSGDGEVLLRPEDKTERVYSEETASVLTHMLTRVTEEGSAAALTLPEMVATAGKTGTSGGGKCRWFVGYTPRYLGGVLCTYGNGDAVEGDVHLRAFDAVMKPLHERLGEEEASFPMAKGLCAVRVCRDSGRACSHLCRLDPRGDREITVWLKKEDVNNEKCKAHVAFWYDYEGDGVVLSPSLYGGRTLSRVALVLAPKRDFPVDIAVSDAEYTAREIGEGEAFSGNGPYYLLSLPKGHYAGRRADGERPFNALSHSLTKKRPALPFPLPEKEEDERGDPHAPRTDGLVPDAPWRKQRERKRGLFGFWRR